MSRTTFQATLIKSRARSRGTLVQALWALLFIAASSRLVADAPTPPVPGVDLSAPRSFVSDALWDADDPDGVLFSLDPDTQAGMASCTKSWTIYVVCKEIQNGVVALNDTVWISSNAASINNAHGGGHSNMGLQEGEGYSMEALIYGALVPSAGDACIALAEHVAKNKWPQFSNYHPKVLELLFVWLMNDYADAAGLDDTLFENPYGGDHDHDLENVPGAINSHQTTAREMVQWMQHAMKDQLFREVVGFRGAYTVSEVNGAIAPYDINVSYSYPGTVASKGGNNGQSKTCVIAQARRIGRELTCSYLNADVGGDGTLLLDYSYGTLFHPKQRGESPNWGAVTDHDLTTINESRAASAVVTPEGEAKIVLWTADLESETISYEPEFFVVAIPFFPVPEEEEELGLVAPRERDELGFADASRGDDGGRDSIGGKYATPDSPIVEAEITHAGEGYLVLATRDTANQIKLSCWGVPVNGLAFFKNATVVGTGTNLQLETVKDGRVILGYLTPDSELALSSWRVDLTAGEIAYNPEDVEIGATYGEFDLAVRDRPGFFARILVAGATTGGDLRVQSFKFSKLGGAIVEKDTATYNSASAFVRVSVVKGQLLGSGDVFAVARRSGAGNLRLNAFRVPLASGDIQSVGARESAYPIGPSGDLEIESYEEGGVLIAHKQHQAAFQTTLSVWAIDPVGTDGTSLQLNVLVDEPSSGDGPVALCRLPTGDAEGDFLLGQNDFFDLELGLEAWRSAARP